MNKINPVEILKFGVIGLGFLLAILAYNLLLKEQKKENPRTSILKTIHFFMIFSVLLCLTGNLEDLIKRGKNNENMFNKKDTVYKYVVVPDSSGHLKNQINIDKNRDIIVH